MEKIKEIIEWATAFKTHSVLLIFAKPVIIHPHPAGFLLYSPAIMDPLPPDTHSLPSPNEQLPFHIKPLSVHCQSRCD